MEGFTLVDGIVALVIVVSAILAYARGLVREIMAIVGWVVAAIVAYIFAPQAGAQMKNLPYVGEFFADSCELSVIAAFATIFALALVVAALFTPLFSSLVRASPIGGIDMALGFLFGAARGIVLVAVGLIAYDRAFTDGAVEMIDQSRSAAIFASLQTSIETAIPEDAPNWIVQRYESLVSECAGG